MKLILTTLLVVATGWSIGYLTLAVIEYSKPTHNLASVIESDGTINGAHLDAEFLPGSPTTSTPPENTSTTTPPQKIVLEKSPDDLVILMAGDIMFDRGIRKLGERKGYDSLFDPSVTSLFKQADVVVANLEGPITSTSSKTLVDGKTNDSFTFTFSPEVANTIARAGITIVSQANNHADNFGLSGYRETQKWLNDAGVGYFGNPWNSTSTDLEGKHSVRVENLDALSLDPKLTETPMTTFLTRKGITVALIGYHAFQTGVDRVVVEIRRVSRPDVFTIVMPHWGEEYATLPSTQMKNYARLFASAGADAVIGAHPHVIMNNEWIDEVPIYYSLGNLLFDQYFSQEVMHGRIIELHLRKDATGIHLDHSETHDTVLVPGVGVKLK